jgi:hypothetical protein
MAKIQLIAGLFHLYKSNDYPAIIYDLLRLFIDAAYFLSA